MKKTTSTGLLALALIAVMVLTSLITIRFFLVREQIIHIETVHMDVTVGDSIGINTDTDALHFGTIQPGGRGMRPMMVENSHPFPVSVRPLLTGELEEYAWTEPKEVTIKSGESERIEIVLILPVDLPKRNYSGTASFIFKRVRE